jgi:hypothetical protein
MSQVPKPSKRQRVRSGDLTGLANVPELRKRAVRALIRDYAHVFADPAIHKRIVNFLFTCYLSAPDPELRISAEFWKAYRHFAEGRSILDFPFELIDREYAVTQLRKILRGDLINLDMEKDE